MNNINVTLASETAANQKGHHQVAFPRTCTGTDSGDRYIWKAGGYAFVSWLYLFITVSPWENYLASPSLIVSSIRGNNVVNLTGLL